VIKSTE